MALFSFIQSTPLLYHDYTFDSIECIHESQKRVHPWVTRQSAWLGKIVIVGSTCMRPIGQSWHNGNEQTFNKLAPRTPVSGEKKSNSVAHLRHGHCRNIGSQQQCRDQVIHSATPDPILSHKFSSAIGYLVPDGRRPSPPLSPQSPYRTKANSVAPLHVENMDFASYATWVFQIAASIRTVGWLQSTSSAVNLESTALRRSKLVHGDKAEGIMKIWN